MKKILLIILFFITYLSYSQETYTIDKTEYYYNQYYSTTGKPVVKRSETNKKIFLKSLGYSETPNGYEIDHIIPLSEGGTDDPSNMQLLTISQHKSKTARERANRSNSTSTNSYHKNSTYNDYYEIPITTANYSRTENGRIIYKGTSGGEYYVNSSGNKVYVKSSTSNSTSSNYSNNSNSSYYSTPTYSTPTSSNSRDIQTGSRGGQYYINSNGNKTYVKK
ncbi:HNH endonuclease signature motif containing protein [Flavobacterium ginsengiterrae]|uniref:HNH nuclease domain-containing protein n=1 Tax=Flavobacterium ginsengiterrae TaxID=871695 RepID=A0ABP7GM88_9FLAO